MSRYLCFVLSVPLHSIRGAPTIPVYYAVFSPDCQSTNTTSATCCGHLKFVPLSCKTRQVTLTCTCLQFSENEDNWCHWAVAECKTHVLSSLNPFMQSGAWWCQYCGCGKSDHVVLVGFQGQWKPTTLHGLSYQWEFIVFPWQLRYIGNCLPYHLHMDLNA